MKLTKKFDRALQKDKCKLPHIYPLVRQIFEDTDVQEENKKRVAYVAYKLGTNQKVDWMPISHLLLANLMRDFPQQFEVAATADNLECATLSLVKPLIALEMHGGKAIKHIVKFQEHLTEGQRNALKPYIG